MKDKNLMNSVGNTTGNAGKATLPNDEQLSDKINKTRFSQASQVASNASRQANKNDDGYNSQNEDADGQNKEKIKSNAEQTENAVASEALKKSLKASFPYIPQFIINKLVDSKIGQATIKRQLNKTKMKITFMVIGVALSGLFSLLMLCVIVALFLAPVAWISDAVSGIGGFFAGLANWFGGNGWCTSDQECQQNNEAIYYEKLTKAIDNYKGSCPINADLITATIFYGQMVDEDKETSSDKINFDYTDVTEDGSTPTAHSKINGLIKVYLEGDKEAQEETYDEEGNLIINKCEISAQRYKEYLINTYIDAHYPSVVQSRGRTKEEVANEILSMGNIGIGAESPGTIIIGAGNAGAIPQEILANIVSPMGSQQMKHTSCFGFYSLNNCTPHTGIDISSSVASPKLYSIADGEVIYVVNSALHCIPDWKDGKACSVCQNQTGNKVTIKHSIVVNGQTYEFYSEYLHMASVSVSMGQKITKGQQIGIMGNTGCSTGTHLHFNMLDASKRRYNPEELLQHLSLPVMSNCDEARRVCSG